MSITKDYELSLIGKIVSVLGKVTAEQYLTILQAKAFGLIRESEISETVLSKILTNLSTATFAEAKFSKMDSSLGDLTLNRVNLSRFIEASNSGVFNLKPFSPYTKGLEVIKGERSPDVNEQFTLRTPRDYGSYANTLGDILTIPLEKVEGGYLLTYQEGKTILNNVLPYVVKAAYQSGHMIEQVLEGLTQMYGLYIYPEFRLALREIATFIIEGKESTEGNTLTAPHVNNVDVSALCSFINNNLTSLMGEKVRQPFKAQTVGELLNCKIDEPVKCIDYVTNALIDGYCSMGEIDINLTQMPVDLPGLARYNLLYKRITQVVFAQEVTSEQHLTVEYVLSKKYQFNGAEVASMVAYLQQSPIIYTSKYFMQVLNALK